MTVWFTGKCDFVICLDCDYCSDFNTRVGGVDVCMIFFCGLDCLAFALIGCLSCFGLVLWLFGLALL